MSFFSDYFKNIKDLRGLSCSQIAQTTGKDVSVIFSWLNNKRTPKNWVCVEEVIDKLLLSEEEYNVLQDCYIRTCLGEEEYVVHQLVMECFDIMRQRSEEYKSDHKVNIHNKITELSLPETVYLSNKMEVLSVLQTCLNYYGSRDDKKLYLDFHMMHHDMLMLIKMFLNSIENCEIEEIVYLPETGNDVRTRNLNVFMGMLDTMIQKNPIEIFCCEESEYENDISENRIISDQFVLVFNENLSCGYLSQNDDCIEYHKKMFETKRKESKNLVSMSYEAIEVAYQYPDTVSGMSYEYMPCIGNCLTKEILDNHIYDEVPGKAQLIEGLLQCHIMNEWNWKSVFSYEGLIEFMETGKIHNFPYGVYKNPDLSVRCELLKNAIKLTQTEKFVYYLIKSDRMYNMKDYYFELYDRKRLSINIYKKEGVIERFSIENDIMAECFSDVHNYFEKIGYIYGREKTCEIMQNVLNQYKAKIVK